MRSKEEYEAALSSLVPEAELDDRPAALRAGAVVPLLTGNRRRRRTRNVVFADKDPSDARSVRLKLDVYTPLHEPSPGQRRPAVLQIHGGAWVLGSKDEQGVPLLNHLASCGWVGFNVNYRLSPLAKFPDHLVDCKKALAWIREHADEYGVDPDFVVVTGGSAGGHLCALMALTQNDPEFQPGFEDADTSVQAAVPFYGVYDLTDRDGNYDSTFVRLMTDVVMGVGLGDSPESWASYSPLDRITADAPPMFVIHGDRDVLVPVAIARSFVTKLREESTQPVVYAELHGAQHAFEVFPSFRTVNTVEYVERFLHHVHGEYLERSATPEAVEPVPDDVAPGRRNRTVSSLPRLRRPGRRCSCGSTSAAIRCRAVGGSALGHDRLDLQDDLDVLAHDQSAGLDHCVEVQAEVGAVDLGRGGEGDALQAVGVGDRALELGLRARRCG